MIVSGSFVGSRDLGNKKSSFYKQQIEAAIEREKKKILKKNPNMREKEAIKIAKIIVGI